MATFDILIKNGSVLDGETDSPVLSDIGINGNEISAVTDLTGSKAEKIVDAEGKYVAPGFIDIQNHADSYFTLLETPTADSLVSQGITTIAVGQCGSSLAPLARPEALESIQKWHSIAGANIDWLSFEEYFESLEKYPLGVNVASLVGHSTVRRGLIGDQVREATDDELQVMQKMVEESLNAGAAGVSLGLVYAHESNASEKELFTAASLVADQNKLYSTHLRSEGANLPSAVSEVIDIARQAQARLKISHFKVRGKKNWPLIEEAVTLIEKAYESGLDVFFDIYPYTTSWTVLYTYLPKWAYEGGRQSILKHLNNNADRKKILDYLRSLEQDLGSIFIATSETNPSLVGKNLHQVAANQQVSVEEALLNVVEATKTQVVVFDTNLSPDILTDLIKHPLSVIATDGAGYNFDFHPLHGLVHPRCFGTMPKFLSFVRNKKIMSWSAAIKKVSSIPAEKLGLENRGKLKKGMAADVVVFDPRIVGSDASYENPYQRPEGIDHVFINGRQVHSRTDAPAEPSGKLLRI